ncbi:MAG: S-layer homology domain-containing protein [Oscillospiraceae bacterium]|nr:S-layer homology domain-containing protein [Oscillospiraceae bacterium]
MKNNLKRLLAAFLALAMLCALGLTALADDPVTDAPAGGDTAPVDTTPTQEIVVPISVELPYGSITLKDKESVELTARVSGEGSGAKFEWTADDRGVAKVSGSGKTAKVTAVGAGQTRITLTVTAKDGRAERAGVTVSVAAAETPVKVSGGASVKLDEGDRKTLSATVSGGSGSYEYRWETDGSGVVELNGSDSRAEALAGRPGSGTVILTVFDAQDKTNNATTRWSFTVNDKQQITAPTLQMNRGSVDLGAGSSGTLSLLAEGGSGNYEYIWRTDNPATVSVSGNGANAEIRAASTVLPGANRAEICAYVRDNQTGLVSNTVTCVVTVSAGNASFNVTDAAKVGDYKDVGTVADSIAAAFRQTFGAAPNGSASVRFTSPVSGAGSLRFQDGTVVRSGTSYSFYTFQTLVFRADAAGTFSTAYLLTDGANTLQGVINISVTGGIAVKSASLSLLSVVMTPNSTQPIRVTASPVNAAYTVAWSIADPNLVSVNGSGTSVTLKSHGNYGTTTLTATLTDGTGKTTTCSCSVAVVKKSTSYGGTTLTYDTSLTVTVGSDYYGTTVSDSMAKTFKNNFGVYPSESDSILFTSLGNSRYGTMYTLGGAKVVTNRTYTFRDWAEMYFIPGATGVYSLGYQFQHGTYQMKGTVKVNVQNTSMTVLMNPSELRMAPYSSQYLSLSIQPLSANYRVEWISGDNNIVSVYGSNATAVLNSGAAGTTTVTAVVTDAFGAQIRRSCTVVVSSAGSADFNPSVSTTLGIPYVGTGTSQAMRSQFAAVYNTNLADNATIRFSSTGNTDVAVMRLADGTAIRPNVDYSLSQYVDMYTQPVSEGTYNVPYMLTYAGKSLSGTVRVMVNAANISTNLSLPTAGAYSFSDPIGASNGGTLLAESIRNTVGTSWSHIRFGATSGLGGTLYLDKNSTPIGANADILPAAMNGLYFVPSAMGGVLSLPYTVYTATGAIIATGTLNLTPPGASLSFTDVPAGAYYAQAVGWAVGKGVTAGTSATTFSPASTVTRGQAVTFLWRAAGKPQATDAVNPFTDVSQTDYFYDAVLWAVKQGITNGTSDTTFSPNNQLNRDQLLTFMCRASGSYAEGDNWSQMAVNWATSHNLLEGVPGTFVAASACPRSDVVYYLWKGIVA